MSDTTRKLRVFLCHSSNDKPAVRELYKRLEAEGWIDPWLDEEKLLPGQDWDLEIEKAVEAADAVIVFLSNNSVTKEGYVQRELRFVLRIADFKPEGTVFVIPFRLDDCPMPRRLSMWQYVDYFPNNRKEWAYQRLLGSIKVRAKKIEPSLEYFFRTHIIEDVKINRSIDEKVQDSFINTKRIFNEPNPRFEIVGFAADNIGASKIKSYEDRSFFGQVITNSNLYLHIGIVADGLSRNNLGQRAAELSIIYIVEQIAKSDHSENEIPQMLECAIEAANKEVIREAKSDNSKKGMATTIAIAVICNYRLYIANVGDSRIYLIRDNNIQQITIDHTVAAEKILQGNLPPEKANRLVNADVLTRAVGFDNDINVDLGLYIDGNYSNYEKASANQGLELLIDDAILVCSDGLVKRRLGERNRYYLETKEIIKVIQQNSPVDETAKILVDTVVGRDVDENVTAVIVKVVEKRKLDDLGVGGNHLVKRNDENQLNQNQLW